MIPEDSIWNDWRGAEAYREYVEAFPLYPALNHRLARLADLERADRVLDVGCGTGTTAAACLDLLPETATLVGIDGAAAMIEIARVSDPRATFLQVNTDDLPGPVAGRFDRIVCNAAFWLLPRTGRVLSALWERARRGARLVFNLPAQRMESVAAAPDPFQWELGTALIDHLGEGRLPLDLPLFSLEGIERALAGAGFRLESTETYVYRGRQEELIELMLLPAMTARLAPELSWAERRRIVRGAAARSDPDLEVEIPWLYFVARAD